MIFMKQNKKKVSYIFALVVIGLMVIIGDLPVIASSKVWSAIPGSPDDCTKPVEVEATLNIAYVKPADGCGTAHQLDIYHPRGLSNTIVLFFVHGGAFRQGDKDEYMELGVTYAGYYNYTTVVVNYRLSSAPYYAVHPDHINDVSKAFSWTYHNISKYGGDPEKIYIFGQSAGAHLVALLATDKSYLESEPNPKVKEKGLYSKIKGVICLSGTYDLYPLVNWPENPVKLNDQAMFMYYGLIYRPFGTLEQSPLDAASAVTHINQSQPPFHLVALEETPDFKDMPGFSQQSSDFYNHIKSIPRHPFVDLIRLKQSDIPPEIREKYQGDISGHIQEIFAIIPKYYNWLPAAAVSHFIETIESTHSR
jgi:hypothetical protein